MLRGMATNNHNNIKLKIKQKIKALEDIIEKEPIILVSNAGKIWVSEKARVKLSEKKINVNDLLEWLKIGVKHLTEASYYDIDTIMMQMPNNPHGSEVLIILRDKQKKGTHILTTMERKVLRHLVKGLSNKAIALSLNIGPGTVNAHLDNIYRKLEVSNRVAAICAAIKLGIVVPAA